MISTNLTSVFALTKHCIKHMIRARYGKIVQISSVVAHSGNAGQSNYCASKAGLEAMSKSLALEVASRGITVNCVAPGFIKTDMTDSMTEEQRNNILNNIPTKSMGTPEDIANAVAFLVSDKSDYITGTTIHVNGGLY